MLPDGVGQQPVDVTIQWVGPKIDHPIDAVTPVSGMLATINFCLYPIYACPFALIIQ